MIPYPEIDPVLLHLGPLSIRWYALAYIAGLVAGWQIVRRLCEQPPKVLTPAKIDDFLLWAALGVILGGRRRGDDPNVDYYCLLARGGVGRSRLRVRLRRPSRGSRR